VMPLPTNTIASSANVLKAGGAQLLWFFSKCSRLQTHPRPHAFHSLPLFSADNIRRRRRSVRWLPSFCTEAATPVSVTAGADDNVEDDGEKKMRMIKEAADTLDIRVGRVLRAWRHEEADSLYVEEVDVGEPEPRIICSGLVNYVPLHHLQVFLS
jgi:aminoacyl tRNA synthase complex-interacting multifunctional protein 1